MVLTVPADWTPGTPLRVQTPRGRTLDVAVPAGLDPGAEFRVTVAAEPGSAFCTKCGTALSPGTNSCVKCDGPQPSGLYHVTERLRRAGCKSLRSSCRAVQRLAVRNAAPKSRRMQSSVHGLPGAAAAVVVLRHFLTVDQWGPLAFPPFMHLNISGGTQSERKHDATPAGLLYTRRRTSGRERRARVDAPELCRGAAAGSSPKPPRAAPHGGRSGARRRETPFFFQIQATARRNRPT